MALAISSMSFICIMLLVCPTWIVRSRELLLRLTSAFSAERAEEMVRNLGSVSTIQAVKRITLAAENPDRRQTP